MMKRSQVEEDNCGHWEFEDQYPESGTLEQSSMPRSLGTTITRRLRFLRTSSRDFTAGMTLVGMASRVDETCSTLQRARTDAPAALMATDNRIMSSTAAGTNGKPSESHTSAGIVIGTTENPMIDILEDQDLGCTQSLVDESILSVTSNSLQELVSSADTDEPQRSNGENDHDKENLDPLGDTGILPRRSPLPEWFPRKPLQDITNVLASDLDDEQPQPKKKRNKKMRSALVPTLLSLRNTPVQSAPTCTLAKPISCATPKQAYNLRKNFR